MRILIDSNVILDALMAREPWVKQAGDILVASAEEKITGYITASMVTDIYYIIHKHLKSREQAKMALVKLLAILDVLEVTGSDCEKALESELSDYEDAVVVTCAKRHKIDYIVTRNVKDFKKSLVDILAPDELLEKIY